MLKLILETEDETIIQKLKVVFKKQESDFWEDLPEHVKAGINRGLADVEVGRVRKYEDVMREIKMKYKI